jgi:magnesium transporter
MLVSEVTIDDDYITVKVDDTVLQVAKAIAKAGVPDAIVLDKDGKALGALDDYDIISKAIAPEKDINTMTAKDIMYAPPPVKLDTNLEEVHKIMNELEATVLPVVDDERKLLGVITIMDVLEGQAAETDSSFFGRLRALFG